MKSKTKGWLFKTYLAAQILTVIGALGLIGFGISQSEKFSEDEGIAFLVFTLPALALFALYQLRRYAKALISTGWGRLFVAGWAIWAPSWWFSMDEDSRDWNPSRVLGWLILAFVAPPVLAAVAWWIRLGFLSPEERERRRVATKAPEPSTPATVPPPRNHHPPSCIHGEQAADPGASVA